MNSFGHIFRFSTFGESHGIAIGCIIDGFPAGIKIDKDFIQSELDRRRPGKNSFSTQRNESDEVEILSGVFEGVSTGTSIGCIVYKWLNMTSKKLKEAVDGPLNECLKEIYER